MANDTVQITTFLLHGDWWFAGFMSFFVLVPLLVTVAGMSELSSLERFHPVGEARLSLARRVPTEAWEVMRGWERLVEALRRGTAPTHAAAGSQLPLWVAEFSEGHGRGPVATGGGGGFRKEVVGVARRFFAAFGAASAIATVGKVRE